MGLPVIAVICACAVVVGVRTHRPDRRVPWYLLAVALVVLSLARSSYDSVPGAGLGRTALLGGYVLYVAACGLLIAAMSGLARSPPGHRSWTDHVDVAVLLLAAALLAWIVVGEPWWRARTMEVAPLWARLSYVVLGVVVLAATTRLLLTRRLSAAVVLVAAGVAGLILLGTLFVVGRARGSGVPDAALLGSALSYAAVGAAALDPSMRTLTTLTPREADAPTAARLVLIALPSLLPSTVLIVHPSFDTRRDALLVSGAATIMMVLVLVRLIEAASRLRGQIRTERAARQVAADLAKASNPTDVKTAVDHAITSLTPRHAIEHVAVLPPDESPSLGVTTEVPVPFHNGWERIGYCSSTVTWPRALRCARRSRRSPHRPSSHSTGFTRTTSY